MIWAMAASTFVPAACRFANWDKLPTTKEEVAPQFVSTSPGWMMFSPRDPESLLAST
jgi:hypothetical protein